MEQNKLPADSTAMVLGIIGLVVAFTGCCCGILAIVGVVLSIIGLVSANKSLREYAHNPENYSPQSRTNVGTAKVLNIIALIINSLVALVMMIYFAFYGAVFSTVITEALRQNNSVNWEDAQEDEYYYDESEDSIIMEDENDSLYYYEDAIQVEESEQAD